MAEFKSVVPANAARGGGIGSAIGPAGVFQHRDGGPGPNGMGVNAAEPTGVFQHRNVDSEPDVPMQETGAVAGERVDLSQASTQQDGWTQQLSKKARKAAIHNLPRVHTQTAHNAGKGNSSYQAHTNMQIERAATAVINTTDANPFEPLSLGFVTAAGFADHSTAAAGAARTESLKKERPYRDYDLAKSIPVWDTERSKLLEVTLTLQYEDLKSIKPSADVHQYARDFLRTLGAISNFHAPDSELTAEQNRLRKTIRSTQKGYVSYPPPGVLKEYKAKFSANRAEAPPITARLQLTFNDADIAADAHDALTLFAPKLVRVDRGTPHIISGKISGIKNAHLIAPGDTSFLAAQYPASVLQTLALKHVIDHVGLTHHSVMYFTILASDFNALINGHGQLDILQTMMPRVKLCTACGQQGHGTRACQQPLCHNCGHARHTSSPCAHPALDHCLFCKKLPAGTAHPTPHLTKNCPHARGYYSKLATPLNAQTKVQPMNMNAPIIQVSDASLPAWRGYRTAAAQNTTVTSAPAQTPVPSDEVIKLNLRVNDLELQVSTLTSTIRNMSAQIESMTSTLSSSDTSNRGLAAQIQEMIKTMNRLIQQNIEANGNTPTTNIPTAAATTPDTPESPKIGRKRIKRTKKQTSDADGDTPEQKQDAPITDTQTGGTAQPRTTPVRNITELRPQGPHGKAAPRSDTRTTTTTTTILQHFKALPTDRNTSVENATTTNTESPSAIGKANALDVTGDENDDNAMSIEIMSTAGSTTTMTESTDTAVTLTITESGGLSQATASQIEQMDNAIAEHYARTRATGRAAETTANE
jgi:hypothetical protein